MSSETAATGGIFIALGSNLGDRARRLEAALRELAADGRVRVLRTSRFHETEAVGGPAGQPPYLNAVAELDTQLAPDALLEHLLAVEARGGRVRVVPNGPRTIDLDLLLYRGERRSGPRLTLPHPRMWTRDFVLRPLAELTDVARLRAAFQTQEAWALQEQEVRTMYRNLEAGELEWRDAYHLCIGFIGPRPIGWVSTVDPQGRRNLAPFSFYNMVSANPPAVFFSCAMNRRGEPKDTLRNVEANGEFVVATATVENAQAMVDTAASLPFGESEFAFAGLTPEPARLVRPALVREAPVNIECRVLQIVRLSEGPGASAIVFGRIAAIHVNEAVLGPDGAIDPHKLRLVGRLGGQWYTDVMQPYEMQIPKPPTA